jgi:hypothetical protein
MVRIRHPVHCSHFLRSRRSVCHPLTTLDQGESPATRFRQVAESTGPGETQERDAVVMAVGNTLPCCHTAGPGYNAFIPDEA